MDPDEAANLNGSDHFCRLIGEMRRLMRRALREREREIEKLKQLVSARREPKQEPGKQDEGVYLAI